MTYKIPKQALINISKRYFPYCIFNQGILLISKSSLPNHELKLIN